MAAPDQVPSDPAAQPRRGLALPPARRWRADRPGEVGPHQPVGRRLGSPGPDQGFALGLAARFRDRLVLVEGESAEDAIDGCVGVGLRRASLFGRAPVVHDLTVAFTVWGFLGPAPAELVALRRPLFEAVGHHYEAQRVIVDAVPEGTLRLPHAAVVERWPARWRELLGRSS
ncbi:hypothetical protein BH18ACT1_BH18ACT1_00050 [soil metagenome]